LSPPSSIDSLSASIQPSPTKISTNADTSVPAIDDESDNDKDDSEIDVADNEENLGTIVTAELDRSRLHRSKKSKHLVLLDLLALLLTTEAKSVVAATMLITNRSTKFICSTNRPFTLPGGH
jgi:hypothetical protein